MLGPFVSFINGASKRRCVVKVGWLVLTLELFLWVLVLSWPSLPLSSSPTLARGIRDCLLTFPVKVIRLFSNARHDITGLPPSLECLLLVHLIFLFVTKTLLAVLIIFSVVLHLDTGPSLLSLTQYHVSILESNLDFLVRAVDGHGLNALAGEFGIAIISVNDRLHICLTFPLVY